MFNRGARVSRCCGGDRAPVNRGSRSWKWKRDAATRESGRIRGRKREFHTANGAARRVRVTAPRAARSYDRAVLELFAATVSSMVFGFF